MWFARRVAVVAVAIGLAACFGACKSRSPELQSVNSGSPMDKPLTTFAEVITSATHELTVTPGGVFQVPVTIMNPTNDAWESSGKYPVVVSYKWFDNGVMLPIEGKRTLLPARVLPGASVMLTVKGTAPQTGQHLLLKITLVQEAVAWFMIKGGSSLEIPVEMKQ